MEDELFCNLLLHRDAQGSLLEPKRVDARTNARTHAHLVRSLYLREDQGPNARADHGGGGGAAGNLEKVACCVRRLPSEC